MESCLAILRKGPSGGEIGDVLKLLLIFKEIGHVQVTNGKSYFLWLGKWNDQPLSQDMP
jgi:hypothetical protein